MMKDGRRICQLASATLMPNLISLYEAKKGETFYFVGIKQEACHCKDARFPFFQASTII